MSRVAWPDYFMNIAHLVAERSTCLRRRVGAVAVKDKRILATGYNGAPRGRKNCVDMGFCTREALKVPRLLEISPACPNVVMQGGWNRDLVSEEDLEAALRLRI